MRSCRGRVRLRALRASAPNNKGRTVNDDKWKTSEDLARRSSLASLLFNAVLSISQLMTLVRETLWRRSRHTQASKLVLWFDSPLLRLNAARNTALDVITSRLRDRKRLERVIVNGERESEYFGVFSRLLGRKKLCQRSFC